MNYSGETDNCLLTYLFIFTYFVTEQLLFSYTYMLQSHFGLAMYLIYIIFNAVDQTEGFGILLCQ